MLVVIIVTTRTAIVVMIAVVSVVATWSTVVVTAWRTVVVLNTGGAWGTVTVNLAGRFRLERAHRQAEFSCLFVNLHKFYGYFISFFQAALFHIVQAVPAYF